jgi:4-aminobutyrate aminotransferase/(S)-3-amino-2-methylpropionate transaminase
MSGACAQELRRLTTEHSALLIADEIWTGLGRSGNWTYCSEQGVVPDLVCFGKGLGGGLPISACLGRRDVMQAWSRQAEVVHTSTFAGAPLACATALATIDVLRRGAVVERAARLGETFMQQLRDGLGVHGVKVRGAGLMIGVELDGEAGVAGEVLLQLAKRGYLVSTGGGARQSVVLTPPLTVAASVLTEFAAVFADVLQAS